MQMTEEHILFSTDIIALRDFQPSIMGRMARCRNLEPCNYEDNLIIKKKKVDVESSSCNSTIDKVLPRLFPRSFIKCNCGHDLIDI